MGWGLRALGLRVYGARACKTAGVQNYSQNCSRNVNVCSWPVSHCRLHWMEMGLRWSNLKRDFRNLTLLRPNYSPKHPQLQAQASVFDCLEQVLQHQNTKPKPLKRKHSWDRALKNWAYNKSLTFSWAVTTPTTEAETRNIYTRHDTTKPLSSIYEPSPKINQNLKLLKP